MSEQTALDPSKSLSNVERATSVGTGRRQNRMRFRPIIALGKGGMAEVLLSVARGPSGFNKLVVLKTMREELATDDELRGMFLAEARLSARLNHPNVVQVYEVVDTALPCIVMEYLEGQPMSALCHTASERFTLPLRLRAISEVLGGLQYSHELTDYDGTPLNLVHRDVSPQNVFLTYDGVVKVLDFGIAKASNTAVQTRTGVVKGKLEYMPPEQLCGTDVDRRADVFAVGCMLWDAAAGKRLWADMPEGDVMRALIEGNVPKPSALRPVDPELEAIIMKALAAEPSDRYATALDLRVAIDQYLAERYPTTSQRELGELVSDVFAEQREERKRQIHLAITRPFSEPPPVPAGLETLVSTGGRTAPSVKAAQRRQMLVTAGIAMGAVLLALGGMIGYLTLSERASKAAPLDTAGTAVAKPALVAISLSATPAAARFTVDGNPISGNPALLTVHPDSLEHVVRASATGYQDYARTIRFDEDLAIEVALQSLPSATGSSAEQQPTASQRSRHVVPALREPAKAAKPPGGRNCDPPYEFQNGIKVYKVGCF